MIFADWPQTAINPLTIQLDDENPRIAGAGLTQTEIRELLLEHEDVAKLSHSIVKNDGLYPHDLVIVCDINGNRVVLEGNRRIAASQMLLTPALIPESFKDKMPRAEKPLQDNLRSIQAIVAPDRASADHLIAQIHAFSARKGWSPIAKYRYAYSRYLEKQDVSQIAADLGSEVSEVRKFIRRYNIFKEIFSFKWTPEEDQILRGEQLQVTPFLYPFERSNIKDLIGDVFDSEGRRNPKYITSVVDAFLRKLARDTLVPLSSTGKPLLTTRGTSTGSIEEYFKAEQTPIIAEFERQKAASAAAAAAAAAAAEKKKAVSIKPIPNPPPPPPPPPPKPTTPRPDDFFETFAVPITVDQKIIRLAWEIAHIDYRRFPVSAAMLTRALLDEILREHLVRVDKEVAYRKSAGTRPGLKGMILYAAETKNTCFKDMQIAAQLARFQNSAVKDDLDNVVHNRYGSISKEALLAIKPYVRPILEAIVQKEWA